MAEAGGGVSVDGGVVVVKVEDTHTHACTKAQVVLQLQTLTQGTGDKCVESDRNTVATVETKEGNTQPADAEGELGYPVTCGESKGVLLYRKFLCPGINVRCVKYNEQLISPKQFVHLSGKATLKDWKRAIRMGGVMLRKMMDSGQLDFYQHDTLCTNTCRSTKFDLLISNARCSLQGVDLTTPTTPQCKALSHTGTHALTHAHTSHPSAGNGPQASGQEEKDEETVPALQWSAGSVAMATEVDAKWETENISEETFSFWKGITDVGLMGEVVSSLRSELLDTLRGLQEHSTQDEPLKPDDVSVLNNVAQVFDLLHTVKKVLEKRRGLEKLHGPLAGLEQKLEEQKKQTRDWLGRSRDFINAVSPSCKRARLQWTSSPATATPQHFTVLSPITFSSLPLGLPLAQTPGTLTLHPLPAGAQVFTRYASPSSAGAGTSVALLKGTTGPEPTQLGTMVSPVEVVHLGQDGDTGHKEGDVEGQIHTTVIEIDPPHEEQVGLQMVPGVQEHGGGEVVVHGELEVVQHIEQNSGILVHGEMVEVEEVGEAGGLLVHTQIDEMEEGANVVLQGQTEEMQDGGSIVLQEQMEEVEGGANVVLQGQMGDVGEMEQSEQLQSVQIVVIERGTIEEK